MVFTLDNPHILSYCLAGGAVLLTSCVVYRFLKRGSKKVPPTHPPNTVILYQFPRGPGAPSLSPFVLKLETYLRMAKIPYEPIHKVSRMGKKGKIPWILYNGEEVADSQFCMSYLNSKLGLDPNCHLSPEEKAIANSFQIMVDEHAYWALVYLRWVHDKNMTVMKDLKIITPMWLKIMRYKFRLDLWCQGMGRHSPEEIKGILISSLKALSDFIGNKAFLMGDTPCQEDCAVFGFVAQYVFHDKDLDTLIPDNFPNLISYCERMKERFWPDWQDCLMKKEKP